MSIHKDKGADVPNLKLLYPKVLDVFEVKPSHELNQFFFDKYNENATILDQRHLHLEKEMPIRQVQSILWNGTYNGKLAHGFWPPSGA